MYIPDRRSGIILVWNTTSCVLMMTHQDNDVQKTCRCLAQCLSLAQDKHLLIALVVDQSNEPASRTAQPSKIFEEDKQLLGAVMSECNERIKDLLAGL